MPNGHLEGYKAGGNILASRGTKFKDVITKLFPEAKVAIRQDILIRAANCTMNLPYIVFLELEETSRSRKRKQARKEARRNSHG